MQYPPAISPDNPKEIVEPANADPLGRADGSADIGNPHHEILHKRDLHPNMVILGSLTRTNLASKPCLRALSRLSRENPGSDETSLVLKRDNSIRFRRAHPWRRAPTT